MENVNGDGNGDVAGLTPDAVFNSGTLSFSENWKSALPEDLQGAPALNAVKDLPSLVKSYVHSNRLTGLDKLDVVPILQPDSPDVLKAEVRQRLGIPDSVNEYPLEIKDVPEGVSISDNRLEGFKQDAFELGITPAIAQELINRDVQRALADGKQQAQESAVEIQKAYDEGLQQLREKWGGLADKNLAMAEVASKTFDPQGVINELGLGNDPRIVEIFAAIGQKIAPDTVPRPGQGDNAPPKTYAERLYPNMK